MIRIVHASSAAETSAARELFAEYADGLGLDLSFQGFEAELASIPGEYTPPHGVLLLAFEDDHALGCVALRPLDRPHTAELKRLYVRPEARGLHLGARLSTAAITFAGDAGYRVVRLDTLPTMPAAQAIYESLGFQEIGAYRFNPVPGARYMELDLSEQTVGRPDE